MRNLVQLRVVVALLLASPGAAVAYIGPGAGITAIGTAIALIGAIILAIVGFIWYPVKRLRAKLRDKKKNRELWERSPVQTQFMQDSFAGDTRTLAQPTLNIGLIRAALTPVPPLTSPTLQVMPRA